MQPLITYHLQQTPALPEPLAPDLIGAYTIAQNGVFYRARRAGLEVMVPVGPAEIRGLYPVEPFVRMDYPRIGAEHLLLMLERARQAKSVQGRPIEIVFHLHAGSLPAYWIISVPHQEQSATHCRPLDEGPNSTYQTCLVELHSHHGMNAFYSGTDLADDRWFRFNAVIGRIFDRPEILVVLGVDGYRFAVPASVVFELPATIRDAGPTEVTALEEWLPLRHASGPLFDEEDTDDRACD